MIPMRLSSLAAAIAFGALLAGAQSVAADTPCLCGEGSTGLELGNRQISVTLKNSNADSEIEGVQCEPDASFLDPGIADSSTGQAVYAAGSRGFSALTSALAAGEGTGTVYASVLGSVSLLVRVESDADYAGPTTIEVEVPVLVDVSGSGSASGTGSQFGGTYHTEVLLTEAFEVLGTYLVDVRAGLATGQPVLFTPTIEIEVDTDYVLTIVHTQQVSASAAPVSGGGIGSSETSGTTGISFDVVITEADDDPHLSRVFPVVEILGVPEPAVGFPPPLQLPEPSSGACGVIAVGLCAGLRRRQQRARRAPTPAPATRGTRPGTPSHPWEGDLL